MNSHFASGRTFVIASVALALCAAAPVVRAQHSTAREWNELLLASIRRDFPRPTVHARNLYHISAAMWDAWATYDQNAKCVIFDETHPTMSPAIDAMRSESLSYAAYRILLARFTGSPGAAVVLPLYDTLMGNLGYSTSNTSTVGNTPAAIGNRIAAAVLAFGAADHSNEANNYASVSYQPINMPLLPEFPGNPNLAFPNRWQPLALQFFIGQNGIPVPTGYPPFLSPEWGRVTPFALSQKDLTVNERAGFDYWVYHDPGAPPQLGTPTAPDYKWSFEMVAAWSSHLDPSDGVMMDASPASVGNATLPTGPSQYSQFYDFANGGDWGTGHPVNPVTGLPYTPQIVPRGDYTRVLAEFWADGPNSETPPGHWFTIFNYVADHPLTVKRIGGTGPVVNNLEWDVKGYLALGGAMHDCAVSAWGVKGWYDFLRPISAIRYMADRYAANPSHPYAITLHPGLIEVVTPATTAPGQRHAHLAGSEGKIAVLAWRGPTYITNPAIDTAGVGWILAENWWPYQRPTFVTPPFAGYVSGHSTYSRAAAVVLDRFTGSRWFPGGLGQFVCPQNAYLVFEEGPSVTVTLQWASYYDASDQCSLSRIWGGIHPPADDIPGRKMGQIIGNDAVDRAQLYWSGTVPAIAAYSSFGAGCVGSNTLTVTVTGKPSARPVLGSVMQVDVSDLPIPASAVVMMAGTSRYVPGIDLGVLGATGCTLDVEILLFELLSAPAGGAQWSLAIPNDPSWLGHSIYLQVATADPMANPFGVTTSNALDALVGL
ncbi:MAG TPA: vanadium-dependent haloperoxidase [Planctomycetota bacterium]|nr:vanadium-dependent haloperoxidase [Planctomycetota bacterium]